MEKLAALSVDLDEIPCYTAIHGLPLPEGAAAHAIYDRCVERFESLFGDLGIPATFFAIGRDLQRAAAAEKLLRLHRAGHEIANHSYHHFYDFSRRPRQEMRQEVRRCSEAIVALTGQARVGFRAPGYVINDAVVEVLREEGVAYDSSVFPCPPYYAAKAAAIGLFRLQGRRSRSIVDRPSVLLAPGDPYRMGQPYWRRGEGLLQLPITVGPWWVLRFPFIGTSVVLAGPAQAARMARLCASRPFVQLELHGIDLADSQADGLGFLENHQPDLRRSAQAKAEAIRAAVEALRGAGFRFARLDEIAERYAP